MNPQAMIDCIIARRGGLRAFSEGDIDNARTIVKQRLALDQLDAGDPMARSIINLILSLEAQLPPITVPVVVEVVDLTGANLQEAMNTYARTIRTVCPFELHEPEYLGPDLGGSDTLDPAPGRPAEPPTPIILPPEPESAPAAAVTPAPSPPDPAPGSPWWRRSREPLTLGRIRFGR